MAWAPHRAGCSRHGQHSGVALTGFACWARRMPAWSQVALMIGWPHVSRYVASVRRWRAWCGLRFGRRTRGSCGCGAPG